MFGSHLSIAGGMHNTLLAAETLGMETVQVFTKNQQQWVARDLEPEQVAEFRRQSRRLGFAKIVAHDSYLINLAAEGAGLREKSVAAFVEEVRRCDLLGIRYLVMHPGAHTGQGEEVGIKKVIEAFGRIIDEVEEWEREGGKGRRLLPGVKAEEWRPVTVCIESTAGQGTCLGHTFEHLAEILAGVKRSERFGICLDTCHLLAAGYELETAEGTQKMLTEFDRLIGMKHLKVWHLNDSKKPRGSRVDRHEHIGRGCVGLAAFGVICRDPRFAQIPKILETPKEKAPDGREWDEINLAILRDLAAGKKVKIETMAEKAAVTEADAKKPPRRQGTKSK